MEKEIKELFTKFLNNQCTVEEERDVNRLLKQEDMLVFLHQLMQETDIAEEQNSINPNNDLDAKLARWQQRIGQRIATTSTDGRTSSGRIWSIRKQPWLRYAAVFGGFLFLTMGSVWLINKTKSPEEEFVKQNSDILPGRDKALLTLADGSTISLSEAENGEIAAQEGLYIEKTADGEIIYRADDKAKAISNAYNSVVTAKGGQYRIILPDGSTALLNAASSLTYPVRFSDNERRVKMTGEIYFEIAKVKNPHKHIPFIVDTDKQEVQVLGTHFNINAYNDEPAIRTTLIEGSVRVTSSESGQSVLLKPGQQSTFTDRFKVEEADVQQQLAWKNGDFIFRGETLESILRKISRWYDVDVECPAHYGKLRFNGMVSRSKPISTIIDIIQSTNKVNVQLKGRRLIVTD